MGHNDILCVIFMRLLQDINICNNAVLVLAQKCTYIRPNIATEIQVL